MTNVCEKLEADVQGCLESGEFFRHAQFCVPEVRTIVSAEKISLDQLSDNVFDIESLGILESGKAESLS